MFLLLICALLSDFSVLLKISGPCNRNMALHNPREALLFFVDFSFCDHLDLTRFFPDSEAHFYKLNPF